MLKVLRNVRCFIVCGLCVNSLL